MSQIQSNSRTEVRQCDTPFESCGNKFHFINDVMCFANQFTFTGCVRMSAGLSSDLMGNTSVRPLLTMDLKW